MAAAGTLLAAVSLLWLIGMRTLRGRTDDWIGQARLHGWTISTGERASGGWPFVASLSVDRVAVSGGERALPGGLSWSADRIVLSISLAHPLTLGVSAEGQQFLRLSHVPDIAFTAASVVARVPLLARHGVQGRFEAVAIGGGIAGSSHPQDVQVSALSLNLRQDRGASGAALSQTRIDLRASGIGLPDIGRWPLGATVTRAGATLLLSSPTHPASPTAPPGGDTPASSQAASWRNGGGRLELRDVEVRWGPLGLTGSVDLHLDSRLQPAGSGVADAAGTGAALDAATQGGLIQPGVALTAKAVLAVMPRVPGSDAIRLPFTLHDSTVSVGQIPLARLDTIGWDRMAR